MEFRSRITGKRKAFLSKQLYDSILRAFAVDNGNSASWEGVTTAQRRKALAKYKVYTCPSGEQRLILKNGKFIVHDEELVPIVSRAHLKPRLCSSRLSQQVPRENVLWDSSWSCEEIHTELSHMLEQTAISHVEEKAKRRHQVDKLRRAISG